MLDSGFEFGVQAFWLRVLELGLSPQAKDLGLHPRITTG